MKPLPTPEEQERTERNLAFLKGSIVIAIISILFFGGIYLVVNMVFNSKNNACIQNPFSYAVKQLEKEWGYDFYALGQFDADYSPLVTINSSGAFKQ